MWRWINGYKVWAADEPPTGGADIEDKTPDKTEDKADPPPAPDIDNSESELLRLIKENPVRTEKEIKDLRSENETLRKSQKDAEEAQEAARKKALEDKEEYKTLYEEANTALETATARITELEEELEAYHQSDAERLKQLSADLPDHLRELISDMSARKALMWIETHEGEIRKPRPPRTDAGASGDFVDGKLQPAMEPRVRL